MHGLKPHNTLPLTVQFSSIRVMGPSEHSNKHHSVLESGCEAPTETEISRKQDPRKIGSKYRTGKWTEEETKFASQIIRCFGLGILKLPPSKTLRMHLSTELDCDPMRITKKFPGTAHLMKVVSDDGKPEPSKLVAQNALLKLNSLKQAFHDSLHINRRSQNSRPMVFTLLDDHEDLNSSLPPPVIHSPPASADILLPKTYNTHGLPPPGIQGSTATGEANVMQGKNHNAPPQGKHIPAGASSVAQSNHIHLAVHMNNAQAQIMQGPLNSTAETSAKLTSMQPSAQLQDVVAKGHSLSVMLDAATPGSTLAMALSNPMALAELWKMQEQQEEQNRKQHATLRRLSFPGYTHVSSDQVASTSGVRQAHSDAPHLFLTLNNFASGFVSNAFSSPMPCPTMQHSHLAPNIEPNNYFTPQPAVAHSNSQHLTANAAQCASSGSSNPKEDIGNPNVASVFHSAAVANPSVVGANPNDAVAGVPFLSNPMHFLTTAIATTSTPAPVSRKPDAAVDMATAATHHTVSACANPSVPIPQAATPRDTGANPMGSLTASAAAVSLSSPASKAPDVAVDARNSPSGHVVAAASTFMSSVPVPVVRTPGAEAVADADSSSDHGAAIAYGGQLPRNEQVRNGTQTSTHPQPDWLDNVLARTV